MASYPTRRTPADIANLRASLRKPFFVANWLDELQRVALAGVAQFPDLAQGATAHLFDAPETLYLALFRAVRAGAYTEAEQRRDLERRGFCPAFVTASLHSLHGYPTCRPVARHDLDRLSRFIAWQYRQEKARVAA